MAQISSSSSGGGIGSHFPLLKIPIVTKVLPSNSQGIISPSSSSLGLRMILSLMSEAPRNTNDLSSGPSATQVIQGFAFNAAAWASSRAALASSTSSLNGTNSAAVKSLSSLSS